MKRSKRNVELFTNLICEVKDFEQSLDDKHAVALKLASAGSSTMLIDSVAYKDPDLVCFYGFVNSQAATFLVHISQLNLSLIAAPVSDDQPKRKIGFVINERHN